MGYNTEFQGVLYFTHPLSKEELSQIESMLGQDIRDHLEWKDKKGLTWINLCLTDDNSGLMWNGDEKSYDMLDKIELIIRVMRKINPKFGLYGSMLAQGEEIDDRYYIYMHKPNVPMMKMAEPTDPETILQCPHCGERFKYGHSIRSGQDAC